MKVSYEIFPDGYRTSGPRPDFSDVASARFKKAHALKKAQATKSKPARPKYTPEPYQARHKPYEKLDSGDCYELLRIRGLLRSREFSHVALKKQDRRHAKDPFLFLSLPAEIRDMIYELSQLQPRQLWPHIFFLHTLSLVSSQIRKESLANYFACNHLPLYFVPDPHASFEKHEQKEDTSRHLHLENDSLKTLQTLSAHANLFRRVTVMVRYYIDTESFRDVMILHPNYALDQWFELSFRRQVDTTPQWTVEVQVREPRGHQSYYGERILQNILYVVSTHIGYCAEAALLEFGDEFAWTPENVERLTQKLPSKVSLGDTQRQVPAEDWLKEWGPIQEWTPSSYSQLIKGL
ncbi:hypothetical protein MBLNU457_g0348t1 [Dothideomycetes sp. NU457]